MTSLYCWHECSSITEVFSNLLDSFLHFYSFCMKHIKVCLILSSFTKPVGKKEKTPTFMIMRSGFSQIRSESFNWSVTSFKIYTNLYVEKRELVQWMFLYASFWATPFCTCCFMLSAATVILINHESLILYQFIIWLDPVSLDKHKDNVY